MIKELIAEAVGTFFFVFSIGVSRGEPFAVGGTLWTAMVFTGFISGAQFNPAITTAIILRKWWTKKLTPPVFIHLLFNILVQVVASILAALVAWGIVRYPVYFDVAEGYHVGEAFVAEMIYTGVICAVALIVGQISESVVYAGGIIALAVTAADWSVGRITGGCFNPAVAIGLNFVYYAKDGTHFEIIWLYIFAPLLGSVIGTALAILFLQEVDAQKHEGNPSLNQPLKD